MSPNYCGMSPDAPAKALARFLTEREVQTPSERSKVWQATTVQRMKARWSNQVDALINPRYHACTGHCVSLKGTLRFITKRTRLARFAGVKPR